ncbi:MAG TPA: molybdate ABC transporter permease subunit [Tissierellaceae bacterium]
MDYSPLLISLKCAILSTIITFFTGIYAAFLTTRLKRYKSLVDGILTLPLVLPPTVVGFLLLIFLGKNGFIGRFLNQYNISIIFSQAANIIASFLVSFPLMYRTIRGAFEQIDPYIIYVARTLGLSEHKIFMRIMLPNSIPSIVAGTVLSFARALGEFGATIMVAGNIPGKTQTMAIAIYNAVQSGNRELAYRWVFILVIISLITVIILNKFEQKGSTKIGRE